MEIAGTLTSASQSSSAAVKLLIDETLCSKDNVV